MLLASVKCPIQWAAQSASQASDRYYRAIDIQNQDYRFFISLEKWR